MRWIYMAEHWLCTKSLSAVTTYISIGKENMMMSRVLHLIDEINGLVILAQKHNRYPKT